MTPADPLTGRILHLQRLSTEDGPGIRTTVFFKGCPLECAWCHNPESLDPRPQVQWFAERCLGCRTCLGACPQDCLSRLEDRLVIDRLHCDGCGSCAEACPSNAIELLGRTATVPELVGELLKDRAFFETSSGGVTLSGGEPLLQPAFARAILKELKTAGVHTAVDTCGLCSPSALEAALPHTDLVLFDLKLADPGLHRRFCGQSNVRILENLDLLAAHMDGGNRLRLWVRTPLIPGATAEAGNLRAIGRLLSERLDGRLDRWELCAFNNLCRDKYTRLDRTWAYAAQPLLTPGELAECERQARSSYHDPAVVLATGPTRLPEM